MSRLYNLIAINERTGRKEMLTSSPVTLDEAYTLRSKFTPHKHVRIQVEEAVEGPYYSDQWLVEMQDLFRDHGYSPTAAKRLAEEGMGPEELRHRLKELGGLERTHRIKRIVKPNPLRHAISRLDAFTRSYIETALWSSTDDDGEPLDKNYGVDDFTLEAFKSMVADSEAFQEQMADVLSGYDSAEAGHDFWLTRNGHGAGFWDGDYDEPEATQLTDAAHAFGEANLYVTDDGQIDLM